MKSLIALLLLLALAGCTGRATPTAEPSPTATWTATAAPEATNTASPTDLPSPTATASPAPSWTPTGTPEATATATSAPTATVPPTGVGDWEAALVVAGIALRTVQGLEVTAEGLRSGTLASIEAGGRLLGYKVAIAEAAQALDQATVPTGLRDGLRANLRDVFGVIDRWQAGELSSGTVGPELATARADAERLLSDLGQAAGLTAAQVAELLATLDEP